MSKQKSWEVVLAEFLKPLRTKPFVTGALATGSQAIGTQVHNSDIDVHIILARGTPWRERGNVMLHGFLIEYFMNSVKQIGEYKKNDFQSYSGTEPRMFALGRIIFDKTGELTKLQRDSKKELSRSFPHLSVNDIELAKYSLWDELDNLSHLAKIRAPVYGYCHKLLLNKTIESYRRFLRIDVGATSKLHRYFLEPDFRKRYALPKFPDAKFTKLFLASLEDESFRKIKKLVAHTILQMGGLEIDGWRVRTKSVL